MLRKAKTQILVLLQQENSHVIVVRACIGYNEKNSTFPMNGASMAPDLISECFIKEGSMMTTEG